MLPPEIWEKIFNKLGIKDLGNISLTSTHINKILTNPDLWSKVILNREKINEEGIMAVFMTKFKKLKKFNLQWIRLTTGQWSSFVNEIRSTTPAIL